jgi:hypothetical protein
VQDGHFWNSNSNSIEDEITISPWQNSGVIANQEFEGSE